MILWLILGMSEEKSIPTFRIEHIHEYSDLRTTSINLGQSLSLFCRRRCVENQDECCGWHILCVGEWIRSSRAKEKLWQKLCWPPSKGKNLKEKKTILLRSRRHWVGERPFFANGKSEKEDNNFSAAAAEKEGSWKHGCKHNRAIMSTLDEGEANVESANPLSPSTAEGRSNCKRKMAFGG